MRNILCIFFLFLLSILFACNNTKIKKIVKTNSNSKDSIEQIQIIYEDFTTLSPLRISCDEFENVFSKSLKEKVIINKDTISKIKAFINKTKRQNKYAKNIDTRFKLILIYQSHKNDTICGNGNVISLKNKIYRIDKDFSSLLIKITDSKYFFEK